MPCEQRSRCGPRSTPSNRELNAQHGVRIETRTGINTGEVVVGDPAAEQTLVTGDAVNTAARLEQAAARGEILIGESTWRLVRDAVSAEPVDPVPAKGKAEPVPAHRLVTVQPGTEGHRRRLDAPLVGRETELKEIRQAYRQAVDRRAPWLCTILGTAGVGKSRLVSEFLSTIGGEAVVLRGRCLSYGEGITYWPLREMVHAGVGITEDDGAEEAEAKVRALMPADSEAQRRTRLVGAAIGLSDEGFPREEIFWAMRRLLEDLSRDRPLVLVFEDIHWAEETLLDLLEYVVDLSTDAPILLLCPARPDLLDARPEWGGSRGSSTVIRLDGLGSEACERLITALPGGSAIPDGLRSRILDAAEGIPLYVEEMLGMLVDEGHLRPVDSAWQATGNLDRLTVPPSVGALLGARIDALPRTEHRVAQRASVVGRIFEAAAVQELTPDVGSDLSGSLLALVRKDLVRPERSELTDGDAFKFRHLLIRDAAYASLPKRERAELHERFASWLEVAAGDRVAEYEAILGHHLHEAWRYRRELGVPDDHVDALGAKAGEWLFAAGSRARRQGDYRAAIELLRSAVETGSGHSRHSWWQLELGQALSDVDPAAAEPVLDEALAKARDVGDLHLAARVSIERLQVSRYADSAGWPARTEPMLAELEPPLVAADDHAGLAQLSSLRASVLTDTARHADAVPFIAQALEHAERGDDRRQEEVFRVWLLDMLTLGETPPSELIARCHTLLEQLQTRAAKAEVRATLAYVHAITGALAQALEENTAATTELREMGLRTNIPIIESDRALYLKWAGDAEGLEDAARATIADMAALGDAEGVDLYTMRDLAPALIAQGRAAEVLPMVDDILGARRNADLRIPAWAVISRTECLLQLGRSEEAVAAFGSIDRELPSIEGVTDRAWQFARLAAIARDLGDVRTARALADEALRLAEAKGFVPGVEKAQRLLAELSA